MTTKELRRKQWNKYQTVIMRHLTPNTRTYYSLEFKRHLTLKEAKIIQDVIESILTKRGSS